MKQQSQPTVAPCPLCGRDPVYGGTLNAHGDQGFQCSCGLTFKRSHPKMIPRKCVVPGNTRKTIANLEMYTYKLMLKDWNRRGNKQSQG